MMKYISILIFIMLLSGCATTSVEQKKNAEMKREAEILDSLYREGRISTAEYWKNKTEILNKNSKNIRYRYNIVR